MPPEFRPDRLLARLGAADVDYVVVGGIAGQAHGTSLFTGGLDICYSAEQGNLDRLRAALVDLGARPRGVAEDVPFVPEGQTLRRTQILTLDTPDGPLDLLLAPDGFPGYELLAARAVQVDWAGTTIKVASLEDLLA